jgi:hypothetical protein
LHASLSSIVSTWNHSDTMATKFTLGTLLHWGVQSNVNEDDTSQWKLWIGIYLKCIHEQGEYFLHNSKNKRNKCINLLLYQWSNNYLPFRGSWVHTHFLCGISVSQSLVFCAVFCIYHCLSFGHCFVCTLTCLCISRHRWEP